MFKHETQDQQDAADYLARKPAPAFLTAVVIVSVIVIVTMPSMTMSVSVTVCMRICNIISMCVCHNLAFL